MFDPSKLYFTRQGKPTFAADLDVLEAHIIQRVILSTGWTEEQIHSKFDVTRYLWGRTINQAVSDLVRDCEKHDAWQKS